MDTEQRSLLDVFMPEDLCARCAEKEASTKFSFFAQTSPSSMFESVRLSFCSQKCKKQFERGWKAARELDSGV